MTRGVERHDPIRVTVIGGYLGAGKTSLINHLLHDTDTPIAVLVNDFGSINIDASQIESASDDVISLANGCICCSLVDGFASALQSIRDMPNRPDRLVIETSGVANPDTVAAYAQTPGFALDAVLVVVDGECIVAQTIDELIGDVVRQQLAAADLVVLNKQDLVRDASRAKVRSVIGELSDAQVVSSEHGAVPVEVIFAPDVGGAGAARTDMAPVDVDTAGLFETWTETTAGPLDRGALEHRLEHLSPSIVRAKGIVHFADEPDACYLVQLVGRRWSITSMERPAAEQSTIVFIAVRDGSETHR